MGFQKPLQVFLCYAREDRKTVERLKDHLSSLGPGGDGVLGVWWDREIGAGADWNREIHEHLEEADVFLALTSAQFQSSGYIQGVELARGRERHEAGECRIVPVKMRSWDPPETLRAMQFLLDGRAVRKERLDEDLTAIARGLRAVVEEMVDGKWPGATRAVGGRGGGVREYLERLIAESEKKARLYAPLQGSAHIKPQELALWDDNPAFDVLGCEARQKRYANILEAFAEVNGAAVLGAPGSGKTTTLRRLAVNLAKKALVDDAAPVPVLADLAGWTGNEGLGDYLGPIATKPAGRPLVLLLDGLNEMPTSLRADKARQVREWARRAKLFVSCREEDYAGELDLGLDRLTLDPLRPWEVRAAVRHWLSGDPEKADRFFWQLAGDEALAGLLEKWKEAGATEEQFWSVSDPEDQDDAFRRTTGAEDELWRKHIGNPRCLVRLAANPFLLTMLFQVWLRENERLPQNRGDLFARFVDGLLRNEELERGDGERLLRGLPELAWAMQRTQTERGVGVLLVTPRAEAERILGAAGLKQARGTTLLEGGEQLRFRHQLLQEYFTAKALQARPDIAASVLWPAEMWWVRSGWEETAVLLAGLSPRDCSGVIRWLAEAQPEVAAQCLLESGAEVADKGRLLAELEAAWMPRLTGDSRPEARAAVGRALGRLGLDRRFGVGVRNGIPEIDWVDIEGFRMSRYPITNAQYAAFQSAADGYANDRWWEGLTDPVRSPKDPWWNEPNHPRETVSWYEAMAFCEWLSAKLGFGVRLPTEEEWERAARGTDWRLYPWGNRYVEGYANCIDQYAIGRTSAVGIYPEGASPDGVMDLSGNVWEWCLNEYETLRRMQRSGTASRGLRGGCWNYSSVFARAESRGPSPPGRRYVNFGFRVACSSPTCAGR